MLERLTTADVMMLRPEEFGWREDVGALLVLDRPVGLEEARRLVLGRLHRTPKLRKVLVPQRWGLGAPLWVDATGFDVAEHVRSLDLGGDADEVALLEAVERCRRPPFDRARPLWELWIVSGLAGGRGAVYAKLHHTVADGVSGLVLLGAFLDDDPSALVPPVADWVPAPPPSPVVVLGDNVCG